MQNNKPVSSGELMNTMDYSYEDIRSFLADLTPINDFHPITDLSYLSE